MIIEQDQIKSDEIRNPLDIKKPEVNFLESYLNRIRTCGKQMKAVMSMTI